MRRILVGLASLVPRATRIAQGDPFRTSIPVLVDPWREPITLALLVPLVS